LIFPASAIEILIFWIGSCLGSFVNVLVYRLPKDESPVFPRSHCPRCNAPIAFYDNIPILSYVILGARCRKCRERISVRYPIIEIWMGILAIGLWKIRPENPFWAAATIIVAAALTAIALIDFDTFLIPDALSLGLVATGLLCAPINPIFVSPSLWIKIWISVKGAAFGFLLCAAIAWLGEKIFKKEAMGGGDIKLLAAVGAWSGVLGAFNCLMLGSLLGSLYGVGLMLRGKVTRSDPIPFGPFLSAGAIINFFWLFPFGFPFRF
jgi:leader peptidase (prepilin peptidase)/N-methyltransferase